MEIKVRTIATHLEGHVLVEIRQRRVAQDLSASVVLPRAVDRIAILELDEAVLVLLVTKGNEFVEHQGVTAHFCQNIVPICICTIVGEGNRGGVYQRERG